MKTACLYIRVSTDEQAITGYSLRSKEDRLLKFCLGHGIDVVSTIQEDHSAKDFNRPGWIAMMSYFKRHHSLCPDLLLFTKCDRFSRNAGDADYMLTQLKKMNIEPRAIDQALGFVHT